MKTTIFILSIFLTLAAYGQSSMEHLQVAIRKHQKSDLKGALKAYDKAVDADENNVTAYFNRALCKVALKKNAAAITDFDKVIELDPTHEKAYFGRSTAFINQKNYSQALVDLDKLEQMNPDYPKLYLVRGKIRFYVENSAGGCEDFRIARAQGEKGVDKLIAQYCQDYEDVGDEVAEAVEQAKGEHFQLDWPDDESWRLHETQDQGPLVMSIYLKGEETIENATEGALMIAIQGIPPAIPMEEVMKMMTADTKKKNPDATVTFIEKDQSAEYPWILYRVDVPAKKGKSAEVQLWYSLQSSQTLYTTYWGMDGEELPADLQAKWTKIFKEGKIVNK